MPAGLTAFLLGHWRAIGALALAVALYGYVSLLRHERDAAEAEAAQVRGEFATFKTNLQALAETARRERAAQELADRQRKEKADEDHKKAVAALDARLGELRHQGDAARSAFLSAVAAATRRAETAEEFGANFERAYRKLVEDLRGIGNACTKAVADLDNAKGWAQDGKQAAR